MVGAKIFADVNYMENKKQYVRVEFTEVKMWPRIGLCYMGEEIIDVERVKVGLKRWDKTVFDYEFYRVVTEKIQYDVCIKRCTDQG